MSKAKWSPAAKKRRRKMIEQAEGAYLGRRTLYKMAKETVFRGWAFATRDRKNRKREFRNLWVARINAACRAEGVTYSQFMRGLKVSQVQLDRKILAVLAMQDAEAFRALVELARTAKPTAAAA